MTNEELTFLDYFIWFSIAVFVFGAALFAWSLVSIAVQSDEREWNEMQRRYREGPSHRGDTR